MAEEKRVSGCLEISNRIKGAVMDRRAWISLQVKSAKQIPVIEVVHKRGAGVEGDPVRLVTQYWSMSGRFLAEYDSEQAPWLVSQADKEE